MKSNSTSTGDNPSRNLTVRFDIPNNSSQNREDIPIDLLQKSQTGLQIPIFLRSDAQIRQVFGASVLKKWVFRLSFMTFARSPMTGI